MKKLITLCILALVVRTRAAEPRLHLIRPDGSALPIVVAQDAAPHTRAAALELATHVESIGGVRPEVIERLPDPLPAQAIWVGYQTALDRLFPGADFTLKHPEEV